MTPALKYPRILLKLSGEALAGEKGFGFDFDAITRFSHQIRTIHGMGAQVAVVIGGGNIVRGSQISRMGMDRVSADYMGMLGTVINALALQDVLERDGLDTRVMTAIRMEELAEPFIRRRAMRHLEKGRCVVFAGGTGNPYFSTDTAATLRALEISAEAILKATKVDGVYDADPIANPNAKKFTKLTYIDALNKELKVMDSTAVSLAMENNLPIIVFNLNAPGSIKKVVMGEQIGTIMDGGRT